MDGTTNLMIESCQDLAITMLKTLCKKTDTLWMAEAPKIVSYFNFTNTVVFKIPPTPGPGAYVTVAQIQNNGT